MPGIDEYTALLLHCNGIDESTDFPDDSENNQVTTAVGTAQVDTAVKKFGTGSLMLDGDSDYLRVLSSGTWNFEDGDFTVDLWVNFKSLDLIQDLLSITHTTLGPTFILRWGAFAQQKLGILINNTNITYESWSPVVDTWYHIAAVRHGDDVLLFVNGTQLGATGTFSGSQWDSNRDLCVGCYGSILFSNKVDGYIDEVRVSKGIARWTDTFIPPTEEYSLALAKRRNRSIIIT